MSNITPEATRGCFKFFGIAFLLCVVFGFGFALLTSSPGEDDDAVRAVKATVQKQRDAMGTFRTAPLKGGTAVLSSRSWAYWVFQGKVYAANGLAMSASPGIPTAPVGVGFAEVEKAVD